MYSTHHTRRRRLRSHQRKRTNIVFYFVFFLLLFYLRVLQNIPVQVRVDITHPLRKTMIDGHYDRRKFEYFISRRVDRVDQGFPNFLPSAPFFFYPNSAKVSLCYLSAETDRLILHFLWAMMPRERTHGGPKNGSMVSSGHCGAHFRNHWRHRPLVFNMGVTKDSSETAENNNIIT